MSLLKYDPLRGFDGLSRKMSDIINQFDKGFSIEYGSFSPRVDIWEDENSINLHAELPGISKEDVKVSINDDNVLVIKGEKKREQKEEKKDDNDKTIYLRVERNFGSFTRSFVLPDNIDRDSVSAKFENGILDLKVTKKEPEKPKEKEISIH